MSNPPLQAPVLAVTDFSPHARHAALRAASVARQRHAPAGLLHVVAEEPLAQLRQWLGAASAPEAQLLAEARTRLDALALEMGHHGLPPVTVQHLVGAPIDEILRHADAVNAQLVVLGARGTGYLRRLVLGSTAERLLRRGTRPLLVVRQAPHEPYRRVLVAVDFSPWSAGAVALARQVAPNAALLLMSVFQVPFEDKLRFAGVDAGTVELYRQREHAATLQRLQALAAAAGLAPAQWQPAVLEGDASTHIVQQEQERDCDLVVLGKHGVSAAVDLLLGSVTKHVLAEGSADLLVSTTHGSDA